MEPLFPSTPSSPTFTVKIPPPQPTSPLRTTPLPDPHPHNTWRPDGSGWQVMNNDARRERLGEGLMNSELTELSKSCERESDCSFFLSFYFTHFFVQYRGLSKLDCQSYKEKKNQQL